MTLVKKLFNAQQYSLSMQRVVVEGISPFYEIDYVGMNMQNFRVFDGDTENRILALCAWTEDDIRAARALWKVFVDEHKVPSAARYKLLGTITPMLGSEYRVPPTANTSVVVQDPPVVVGQVPQPPGPPYTVTTTTDSHLETSAGDPESIFYPRACRTGGSIFNFKDYVDSVVEPNVENLTGVWGGGTQYTDIFALAVPSIVYTTLGHPEFLTGRVCYLNMCVRAEKEVISLVDSEEVLPAGYTLWKLTSRVAVPGGDNEAELTRLNLAYSLGKVVGAKSIANNRVEITIDSHSSKSVLQWTMPTMTPEEVNVFRVSSLASAIRVGLLPVVGEQSDYRDGTLVSIISLSNGCYSAIIEAPTQGEIVNGMIGAYLMLEYPENLASYTDYAPSEFPVTPNVYTRRFTLPYESSEPGPTGYGYVGTTVTGAPYWDEDLQEYVYPTYTVPHDASTAYVGYGVAVHPSTSAPVGFAGGYYLDTSYTGGHTSCMCVCKAWSLHPTYWDTQAPIYMDDYAGLAPLDMVFLHLEAFGTVPNPAQLSSMHQRLLGYLHFGHILAWFGGNVFKGYSRLTPLCKDIMDDDSKLYDFRLYTVDGTSANVVSFGANGTVLEYSGIYFLGAPWGGFTEVPDTYGNGVLLLGNGYVGSDVGENYPGHIVYDSQLGLTGPPPPDERTPVTSIHTTAYGKCFGDSYYIGSNSAVLPQRFLSCEARVVSSMDYSRQYIYPTLTSMSRGLASSVVIESGSGWDGVIYTAGSYEAHYVANSYYYVHAYTGTFTHGRDLVHDSYSKSYFTQTATTHATTTINNVTTSTTSGGEGSYVYSVSPMSASLSASYAGWTHDIEDSYTASYDNDLGRYVYTNNGSTLDIDGARASTQVISMVYTEGTYTPVLDTGTQLVVYSTSYELYNKNHAIPVSGNAIGIDDGVVPSAMAAAFPVRWVLAHSGPHLPSPNYPVIGDPVLLGSQVMSVGDTGTIKHLSGATCRSKSLTPEIISCVDNEYEGLRPGIAYILVIPDDSGSPYTITIVVHPEIVFKFTSTTTRPVEASPYRYIRHPDSYLPVAVCIHAGSVVVPSFTGNITTSYQSDYPAYVASITITQVTVAYTGVTELADILNSIGQQATIVFNVTKENYDKNPFSLVYVQTSEHQLQRDIRPFAPVFLNGNTQVAFFIKDTDIRSVKQLQQRTLASVSLVDSRTQIILGCIISWNTSGPVMYSGGPLYSSDPYYAYYG